eukprot:CAMPEP_0194226960 /NCGR_PEP_ID=MMETSP0156-20130528/42613_1 /TAXON_ID=33649 /ORGANISM="Thalassionema nitzschioides, Strain L26-B" /LENGTH=322 /DNA_ID=CAMNT_0038959427 /DNA_START=1293 /DNA_END=2261 /DNA_ORIENTATION=-
MNTLRLPSNTLYLKSEWIGDTSKKLPHYRSDAAGGRTKDGKFILTGGMNKNQEPKRSVWIYHNGEWDTETLPPMNIARSSHGLVILNKKVYVLGGRNHNGYLIKSVEMFDLKNPQNGWTFVSRMKAARMPLAVAAVPHSNSLYVFGCSSEKENRSVECLDLSLNAWKRMPDMPHSPRMLETYGSAIVGDKVYVLGSNANQKKDSVAMIFDPLSSSWVHSKELNLKLERSGRTVLSSMTFVDISIRSKNGHSLRNENISIRSKDDHSLRNKKISIRSKDDHPLRKTKQKQKKAKVVGGSSLGRKAKNTGKVVMETGLTVLSFL